DSFKVYCEVRAVGGLVRSPAVNDLLEPLLKLGRPPKEFKTLLKWLDAHAEALAGSRVMIAGWASRPKLPSVLAAIEFSSPEEAKKFHAELRDFIPKLLPTPTPAPSPLSDALANSLQDLRIAAEEARPPQPPPYQMQQAGSLVLISDTAFTLKNLKPRGSKPLEEDQNFLTARNRFASESVFLYVDLKSIEKEEKAQREKWEKEAQKQAAAEAANPPRIEEKTAVMPDAAELPEEPPMPSPDATPPATTELRAEVRTSEPLVVDEVRPSGEIQTGTDEVGPGFFSLYGALFGGESKWPEAVGAALVFENDAYVIRTLLLNNPENKGTAIPFAPQFVSGPAIVPQSPNVFPADSDFFVSLSADYPQIYEGMLKAIANAEMMARKNSREPVRQGAPPESPFAFYEKKLGLKIKDDLLPLLGNEMAMALGKKSTKALKGVASTPAGPDTALAADTDQKAIRPADPIPIFAIAVKDREAVGRLIPKVIEAIGFKGANLLAQTEKRDGTEITTYGGAFSYAFIADFLVVSPDAAETRRVVDAYLNHETLASNSHFKNYTRWQPQQVLGQIYVGPELMEAYNPFGLVTGFRNVRANEFLSRLSPLIEPTTYALSNDGSGPLHELHIPRNLVQWMIGSSLSGSESASAQGNDAAGQDLLMSIYNAEASYQVTQGNDNYGTLDELVSANLINRDAIGPFGYRLEVTVSGSKFEATAIPVEYGVTGTLSYFIDESGVLRGGDHGGGAATAADPPVQ
ncbi:MAG TPA: DUF3352 domain-containing protein, partial [Pyrinomonadaceae bacterium]